MQNNDNQFESHLERLVGTMFKMSTSEITSLNLIHRPSAQFEHW